MALQQLDDALVADPGVGHQDDVDGIPVGVDAGIAGDRGEHLLLDAKPSRQVVSQSIGAVHDDEGIVDFGQVARDPLEID